QRPRVKGGEPTAGKIIVNLGSDGSQRQVTVGGAHAQREDTGVAFGSFPPFGEGLRLREKLLHTALVHTGLAAAIDVGAQAGDNVGDNGPGRGLLSGIRRDDSVAVE